MGVVLCSLLGLPCLRVGTLLACGVYGAISLRSLQSRLPFVFGPPSPLFVLHLLLRWGGLVTGLWPLLLILCVGLLWGLCCAVLSPWALALPTLSGLRLRIPMVSWSMLLVFSWTLSWGSFLSLPVVTDGLGWLLPALRAGSPTYDWCCVLRRALVLVAVPPSQVGPAHSHWLPFLWTWCTCGLQLFTSPMYTFGMCSPFGSIVSFCHS